MCLSKCISRFLSKQYSYTRVINSVFPKFDLESIGSKEMMLEMKSINIWINTWTELQCLTFSVLQWGLQKKCYALLTVAAATKKTQHPKKQNNNKSKAQTSFS